MVILQGARRIEITVTEEDGEWRVKLCEFVPGRYVPTIHLLRCCVSRHAALEAAARKWRLLFPDDAALVWHEPPQITARARGQKGPLRFES
jgi:hypothetical protein